MAKKRKVEEASIGDLFAYLAKNTFRLRAVDLVSRTRRGFRAPGWVFDYGTGTHVLRDKEILADLGARTKADDAPYGR